MRFLALDLGSSYTKCFVLENGRCLKSAELPTPPALNASSARYELDAEAYFQDVRSLLNKMVTTGTQGILLSTQMHGYVLTAEDFTPAAPYVSWQDRACREMSPRGRPWMEELGIELDREAFRDSGVPVKDSLAMCNLYARLHTGLALGPGTRLHTLGGYMLARLCGRHVCHLSNAGPLGLADMRRGAWNTRVIASAGMASLELPELVWDLSPVGETVLNGQRVDLYPDIGDQQVCAFGADLPPETGLHVNIGTAGLIGSLSREWREGPFENRAWLMPGMYLRTVSGLPGGRDLQRLHVFFAARDHLESGECWARLCAAQAEPADVPWNFSDLTSSLAALPAGCSLEAAACSFYGALAERYKAAARGMMGEIASVRFSGGTALKNPALRKALLVRFPAAGAGEGALRDVSMGFEALAHFVQVRTEKTMNKERLKSQLAQGKRTFGMMLSELYVPNITRMIANCGYDFLLVDCEHGYFDMTQVANLIAVADGVDLPILVRVTQPSRTMITKYLDMGARGILLSDVANAQEARQLAELCMYAPQGNRGVSTFRAHTGYKNGDTKELMRRANASMIVICQIESPQAVEDIRNIVAIDGIDGVLIGPNDLTQHMGLFEQFDHPQVDAALVRVEAAAREAGKWSGVITGNRKLIRRCMDIGMTCFSAGSELNALVSGAMAQMETLKALCAREG